MGEELVPVTLPNGVARMYLEMDGEWDLRPLAGICMAPLLSSDGSIRIAEGYDQGTRLLVRRRARSADPGAPDAR